MAGRGQIAFHSGSLFAKSGLATVQVATLQEVSFDFKASNKELTGENLFAEAVGRGNVKVTGKAKSGRFNGQAMNTMFFNQPSSSTVAGAKLLALDEAGTVASAAITVLQAATFEEDLGVQLASTGAPLTRVASSPASGQYSVNEETGVYSFHTSANDAVMRISYLYSSSATGASTLRLVNTLAGEAPTFRLLLSQRFQSQTMTVIFNAVVSESLGFAFKNEDFAMPDFAFACQVDDAGVLGEISMTRFA